MDDVSQLLNQLDLREKSSLVAGTNFMYTKPMERLGVPSVRMSDGPHGLRVQNQGGDNGVSPSEPATAFPTAALLASSWNPDYAYKMGKAIAEECRYYGVHVLLGPGANIKRNPLGGRNFEYFSEDPFLAGKMASGEVKGLQDNDVSACVKHFALNNSENFRFMGNSLCDKRAMREIYLRPFEIIAEESKPDAFMCSYNQINGIYSCQNKWLLTDLLRKEWGFNGLLMTDWGATHDRVAMLKSGLDLEMPGDTAICRKWIVDGVGSGELESKDLDKAVSNVLNLAKKHEKFERSGEANFEVHHRLAAEIAEDGAVLLKNDGVLPLSKGESYCVLGELFEKPRYQGSGSSMINPAFLSTPKSAFDARGIDYVYAEGYKENAFETDNGIIEEALARAEGYDRVLVFAGLTDYFESEGVDRENMALPKNQLSLIETLIRANKEVVLILYGGSPVELPFEEGVAAILNMYLPGQNGGEALANLLFGDKTPSGKLAETWPNSYSDVPFGESFGKSINEIYKESVFVGYRYYLTSKKKVRYPFGYGLSYTSFEYSDIAIKEDDDEIEVSCTVKNAGRFEGAEIVQLYVKAPLGGAFKPAKELKGFAKAYLKAGESKQVRIKASKDDLRYWNVKENRFVSESGEYVFEICSDCQTCKLKEALYLKGEDVPSPYAEDVEAVYGAANLDKVSDALFETMSGLTIPPLPAKRPIALTSRFSDLKQTFMGKILFSAVLSVADKDMKKAKSLPQGPERDNKIKGAVFLRRILESNSILSMSMSAGKSFPYNFACGFVDMANSHVIEGIKNFCSPIKEADGSKNR